MVTNEKTTKPNSSIPSTQVVQVIFPVTTNAKPQALIIHCVDPRFQKAFRNFIEGSTENGCLGLGEGDYVSLVIPGGISSLSEAMAFPKHFKVAKEHIQFILNHFPDIRQVILINHEDCSAYKFLQEQIGTAFLRRFTTMFDRQCADLGEVAKTFIGLDNFRAKIKLYIAKFADPEHTKVGFREIKLG